MGLLSNGIRESHIAQKAFQSNYRPATPDDPNLAEIGPKLSDSGMLRPKSASSRPQLGLPAPPEAWPECLRFAGSSRENSEEKHMFVAEDAQGDHARCICAPCRRDQCSSRALQGDHNSRRRRSECRHGLGACWGRALKRILKRSRRGPDEEARAPEGGCPNTWTESAELMLLEI